MPKASLQTEVLGGGEAQVAYDSEGDGHPAVVLIHGYGGDRSHWHHQLRRGLSGCRVVAIDLLGHGESDAPHVPYSMDLFAECIAAVLDDVAERQAVLVGHSNGVPVVRQFYRRYADRTRALIAVDGTLRALQPERMEMMIAPLRTENWRAVLERMAAQTPLIAPQLAEADQDLIQRVMLATPHHVLLGAAHAMTEQAIWAEDGIGVPLSVISTRSPFSDLHSADYQAFVRRLAPTARFAVWENISHFVMMEDPERFEQLLRDVVTGLP